jgi:hypothetical protein
VEDLGGRECELRLPRSSETSEVCPCITIAQVVDMKLSHPFERLPTSTRRRVLPVLVVLTLALTVALQIVGRPLQTAAAPQGIISFELAGNLPAAQAIIASWDSAAQLHAALSLGLDYLYMPLYAIAIALACVQAAGSSLRSPRPLWALGIVLAWALGLAALLDAVENFALFQLLVGSTSTTWPVVAKACATAKFAFVIGGLFYAGIGGIAYLIRRDRRV